MRSLSAIGLALLAMTTGPAMAQGMDDLVALAEATWAAVSSDAMGADRFAVATAASGLSLSFEDRSDRRLPADWHDLARVEVGWSRRYSALDGVECAILSEAGITRVLAILDRHGDRHFDHLPEALHPFARDDTRAMLEDGAITSVRSCLGSFQVGPDEIDLEAWQAWYDQLQVRFEAAGLAVSRTPPGSATYAAGFMTGAGPACDDHGCMAFAAPFNVVMPGFGAQATLTVTAGSRR